jgi:hypothetical protein
MMRAAEDGASRRSTRAAVDRHSGEGLNAGSVQIDVEEVVSMWGQRGSTQRWSTRCGVGADRREGGGLGSGSVRIDMEEKDSKQGTKSGRRRSGSRWQRR